jgi:hypothetical protein
MVAPDGVKPNPFPEAKWKPEDKPVVVIDGHVSRLVALPPHLSGHTAYIVGLSARHFPDICRRLDVEVLQFREMWVSDLSSLASLRSLRHLAIRSNLKASDIAPLSALPELRTLVLEATPRIHDLAPLVALRKLTHLEFGGGLRFRNTARSLAPLADLPDLADLSLFNLKVSRGGLAPLAGCAALRELSLSNQFPTEQYAKLSVFLPHVRCQMFAPYLRLTPPVAGHDVMVVGRRKPLLNSQSDQARLHAYEEEFRRLQERYRRIRGA